VRRLISAEAPKFRSTRTSYAISLGTVAPVAIGRRAHQLPARRPTRPRHAQHRRSRTDLRAAARRLGYHQLVPPRDDHARAPDHTEAHTAADGEGDQPAPSRTRARTARPRSRRRDRPARALVARNPQPAARRRRRRLHPRRRSHLLSPWTVSGRACRVGGEERGGDRRSRRRCCRGRARRRATSSEGSRCRRG
jgi:hypothetical protein